MKILVAVSDSEASQAAIHYMPNLLEHFSAEVDAVYVKPDLGQTVSESAYLAFATKDGFVQHVKEKEVEVLDKIRKANEVGLFGDNFGKPKVVVGDPTEEILDASELGGYDLVVLGASGHSLVSDRLLGTVHSKIVHLSLNPVLFVGKLRPIRKILIAFRGPRCDHRAVNFIGRCFALKKPEITVMHVRKKGPKEAEGISRTCLGSAEKILKPFGHAPLKKAARGDFVEEVLKVMATGRHDLLVLSADDHGRPRRLKDGSDDALNLFRLTARSVLVYRGQNQE